VPGKETWPFHSWGSGKSLQHVKGDTQVNGISSCDGCDSWDDGRGTFCRLVSRDGRSSNH
jgi:hypothetical protein